MAFPRTFNNEIPLGIEGDFCSGNNYHTTLAGEGALVVGTGGLTIGRFAWVVNGKATNAGTGMPNGFVHRELSAIITDYLGRASNVIQAGQACTLLRSGDFWAKTLTVATVRQKVFASTTTGQISTGAVGATIAGSVETEFYVHSPAAAGELIKISKAFP